MSSKSRYAKGRTPVTGDAAQLPYAIRYLTGFPICYLRIRLRSTY